MRKKYIYKKCKRCGKYNMTHFKLCKKCRDYARKLVKKARR